MTALRSLLTSKPLDVFFPEAEKKLSPTMHNVMLHKIGGKWNEFYMGKVVTFLDLQDWCRMNGYKLVQEYVGRRVAFATERTDLF